MKVNKIISITLSLCMILSVLSLGALTASAESVAGGWEFSDVAAENVTAEEKAILSKALNKALDDDDKILWDYEGTDFEAKDVIAVQSVAGTNYAFLCVSTYKVMEPVYHWVVVTVYEALDGTVTLEGIKTIDPADVKTTDELMEIAPGCWSSTEKETAAPVPENVQAALQDVDGVSYSPIAILGTQVVAGTNYRILCYGTAVYDFPRTDLYVIDVYAAPGSAAEITSVGALDLHAYVDKPIEEDPDPIPSGGWEFSSIAADNVTAEEKAILSKALSKAIDDDNILLWDYEGTDFEAKDVIAEQAVAGTNYAFLCVSTYKVMEPVYHWVVVTVYETVDGTVTLEGIKTIDPADVKTTDEPMESAPGSWMSQAKENAAPVPEDVKAALAEIEGVSYSPIAVLGTQVVAGTNYRILCYGTLATAVPVTNLYVIDVYSKLDGTAEITSIKDFDLPAYVSVTGEPDTPVDDPIDDPVPTPVDDNKEINPDIPNPNHVPATGSTETAALAVVLVLLSAAVLSAGYARKQKQK